MSEMSKMSDWLRSDWFELGSLLVQCAILVVLVWYARKALRTRTASQEQVEALQGSYLTQEAPAYTEPERAERGGKQPVPSWRRLIRWLGSPVGS